MIGMALRRDVVTLVLPRLRGTGTVVAMRAKRVYSHLRRWEDEGGAPLVRRRSITQRPPSPSEDTALYYFNIRTDEGVLDDDQEGLTLPDLKEALHEALALARQSLAEGDRKGRDRRGWQVEITDRTNQHLLTVTFSEATVSEVLLRPDED